MRRKEYIIKNIVILTKARPPRSLALFKPTLLYTLFYMIIAETSKLTKKTEAIQATFFLLFLLVLFSMNNKTSRHCFFFIQYVNVAVNSCQEEKNT